MSYLENIANAYREYFLQFLGNSQKRLDEATAAIRNDTYTVDQFFRHCLQAWQDVYDISPFVEASGVRLFTARAVTVWKGSNHTIPPIPVDDADKVRLTDLVTGDGRMLTDPKGDGSATCIVDAQADKQKKSVQVRIHSFQGRGTPEALNGHYLGYLYDSDEGTIVANVHVHIRLPASSGGA